MEGHKVHGDKLRDARIAKGMSQVDLVKAAGVSRSYVRMIEAGDYQPTARIVAKLARGLDCDQSVFCTPDEQPAAAGTR